MNYGKNKRKHLPFVLKDVITFEKKKKRETSNILISTNTEYWCMKKANPQMKILVLF